MAISNASIYLISEVIAHSIDDAQTLLDAAGTDPTHSQLAKDHDDHPLHELAALLARAAVRDVGEKLMMYWAHHTPLDADFICRKYLKHPKDFVLREELVVSWVNSRGAQIETATHPTVLHEAHHHLEKSKAKLEATAMDLYRQYLKIRDYFSF